MALNDQTVEERVERVVAQVFRKESGEVKPETRLLEDLYAKSIDIIELTAVLENEFDVEISGSDSRKALTVGQFAVLIEGLIKK
ncbi:MAG: acyl carrier protein [Chlamydiales bacterium]|nr:acyl carrier protein [Chlamydiales bacterium]